MYFADMRMTDRRDSNDPRFDRWLSRRLHEAYDSVLKEQLPAELDRLVQQLGTERLDADPLRHRGADDSDSDDDGPEGRPALVCVWSNPSAVWH